MHVMKNEGSSAEIPSVRKCHRPLRKKGGVKRLADEDVSVPGGALTPVAAPNVSPDVAPNVAPNVSLNDF